MRIITVRQPWAWAIIHGGKDVDNRTRNIAGEWRGTVAIHAGLATDLDALPGMADLIAVTRLLRPTVEWYSNSPNGAIIGVVDLVDVHDESGCPGLSCSPWASLPGESWHLILANPRPLPEPIPYKGALGLRELPADVEALIRAQLEAS